MSTANITEQIKYKALDLLKENPQGLKYSELMRKIIASNSNFNPNTIQGSIWNLDATFADKVYKPSRGLFRLIENKPTETVEVKDILSTDITSEKLRESDFYNPFAEWLKYELQEVTHAIPLGGNIFKDKWGTPDVIGVYEPLPSDIIKAPIEVISAEIKTDTSQLITAFGQASAYKLFSHKVWLVIPKDSSDEDRLISLCKIFGIGLVVYNSSSPENPNFTIKAHSMKHEPDFWYTNKYLKIIETDLFSRSTAST